jgi:hypothetical protein
LLSTAERYARSVMSALLVVEGVGLGLLCEVVCLSGTCQLFVNRLWGKL